ncbi:hypothetical protein T484DRAFT_3307980 [Baffinella frigidus]|nr:hypothetical protein T484DRAFT_3307980 [Cryptophyta sp. CCMP2293]
MGATRFCMLRMGDAAVAVRNLPFKIGAGEDADMVWGGMSCEIETSDRGCELLTVSGAGAMVNGKAMGEGDRWALFNGDVVAMAAGGLQFVVEDIRVEASASALPPPERGVRESGGAGAFQALELAMEKALECIICHETMHRATSLIPCLHTMCAACASKCLAGNDACPTCRVPVTATGLAFTVNEAVDALHAATPGRKRPADDLLNMDRDAESLERHVERIVRQRERIVRQRLGDSLLDLVRGGDVAAVQDAIDDGGDIDERVEGVGSLLHVAVDAENLAMVDALIEREVDLEMDGPLGTAANLAANRGLVGILLSLLDAGADAEQIDDLSQGQFLLMRATRSGSRRCGR